MNTGIQDMMNLGWKLAMVLHGKAAPGLLDTYGDDRLPVIKNVLEKTEGLTAAIGNENKASRQVFAHIAPWLTSTERATLRQMHDFGAVLSSVLSIATALEPDFTSAKGQQMFQTVQALRLA